MTETRRQLSAHTGIWRTLRFRFAMWIAGFLLAILAGFGAFVYLTMERSLFNSVDEVLRLNASQALSVIEFEAGTLDLPSSFVQGPETARLREQGFILRILDSEGKILRDFGAYKSLPVTSQSIAAAQAQDVELTTLSDPATGDIIRLYTIPIVTDNHVIGIYQVGRALTDIRNTLDRLLRALLIGGPGLVLLAGIGGYLLAARALAPIDAITRTARRISAEDLSSRLNLPATGDEVGRLAETFDAMLARLEDSFEREQQFTADASHELRTPLAAMRAILDVIGIKQRTTEEYQQALHDLAEETDQLNQLTESLLLLARGNGQGALAHEPVDLSTLLADVSDSWRPLAASKGLTLTCNVPDNIIVSGSSDALIRMFANLIDNAVKYTGHGQVTISTRLLAQGLIEAVVKDTGIGISAEHLPHIFERFYRVEKSRTSDGMGLGLAIAQQIARDHKSSIEVNSLPGSGTTFTIYFPLAGPGVAPRNE